MGMKKGALAHVEVADTLSLKGTLGWLIPRQLLDGVQVRAGGAIERFSEAEVELAGHGGNGDLNRLATCLGREWGLRPEVRSKMERALALIDAGSKTPVAH